MKRRIINIIITIMLCMSMINTSALAEAVATSNITFASYSIDLSSGGSARFSATLYDYCTSFKVQSCTLQKLSGSTWVYSQSLECPSGASSINVYSVTKDYSSNLTKGRTYRLVVVYNADGVTVTATSPQITY